VSLSRPWFLGLVAALPVIINAGCHESRGAQTDPVGSRPSAVPVANAVPAANAAPAANAVASARQPMPESPSAVVAVASAAPTAPGNTAAATQQGEAPPALLDDRGKPLAQTDQRPTLTSPSFQKRVTAVARAILTGDVEPALEAFFPLVAYQQVKDVAKPERDYKFRLVANFKRDLLDYHRALGAAASESKFEGIDVSEKDAKWMAPGTEGNRLGYFRVLRSRLRFTLPTGRSREFELTSLISWRGEWYVVHLHGFK